MWIFLKMSIHGSGISPLEKEWWLLELGLVLDVSFNKNTLTDVMVCVCMLMHSEEYGLCLGHEGQTYIYYEAKGVKWTGTSKRNNFGSRVCARVTRRGKSDIHCMSSLLCIVYCIQLTYIYSTIFLQHSIVISTHEETKTVSWYIGID